LAEEDGAFFQGLAGGWLEIVEQSRGMCQHGQLLQYDSNSYGQSRD
jgi:hypothetical protein